MIFPSAAGPAAATPPLTEQAQEGTSLTRFCLSLRTRLFSLDFTWGRLRTNSSAQSPAPDRPRPGGIRPEAKTQAALRQRDEIERRWRLAALLTPVAPGSAGKPVRASFPATNPQPVCRAYALAADAPGRLKADGPTS